MAAHLDMPTSPDTLLRRVKAAADEPEPTYRYVGIDDWAIRKGQSYGTILVDLERGCVIDLLPGRDGSALKAWLLEHPGVEVITRDRWPAFARAAAEAAPQARQVADRWHLLKNLREVVERLLTRMHETVCDVLKPRPVAVADPLATDKPTPVVSNPTGPSIKTMGAPDNSVAADDEPSASSFSRARARVAKSQQRALRFERVHELRKQGHSIRAIASMMGLSVKCVFRYLHETTCPDWETGQPRSTQLDRFAEFISEWIARGGSNAAELYRDLEQRGYAASYDAVRRYLARRIGTTGRPGPRTIVVKPPVAPPPSSRKLSFEIVRRPDERNVEQQQRLEALRAGDPALRSGLDLAIGFADLVRRKSTISFAEWLKAVETCGCAELRSFAESLQQDEAAVNAALTEDWSNGPVEGHVNRLKVIKRQMYGRAKMPLLRSRVRQAG